MFSMSAPAFRLNAPQPDDGGAWEDSNPFGSIGNHVTYPSVSGAADSAHAGNNNSFVESSANDPSTSSLVNWLREQQQQGDEEREQRGMQEHRREQIRLSGSNDDGSAGEIDSAELYNPPPSGPSIRMAAETMNTLTERLGRQQGLENECGVGEDSSPTGNKEHAPRSGSPPTHRWVMCLAIVGLLMLAGLIVAVTLWMTGENNGGGGADSSEQGEGADGSPGGGPGGWTSPPSPLPVSLEPTGSALTPPPGTTLGRIYNAGVLKCGVLMDLPGFATLNEAVETQNDYVGFDADLCKAVAAAIFGDADLGRVEYFPVRAYDRFLELHDGTYDMVAGATTRTMEREVLEVSSVWRKKFNDDGGVQDNVFL
jgi:Bacterial extracellular solute-binding proteins, family 3